MVLLLYFGLRYFAGLYNFGFFDRRDKSPCVLVIERCFLNVAIFFMLFGRMDSLDPGTIVATQSQSFKSGHCKSKSFDLSV